MRMPTDDSSLGPLARGARDAFRALVGARRYATGEDVAPSRFLAPALPFNAKAAAGRLRVASRDLAAMGMPSDLNTLAGLAPLEQRPALLAALVDAGSEVDAALHRRYR